MKMVDIDLPCFSAANGDVILILIVIVGKITMQIIMIILILTPIKISDEQYSYSIIRMANIVYRSVLSKGKHTGKVY